MDVGVFGLKKDNLSLKLMSLVSVIMPVYNSRKYLAPAIESILHQTHTNLELIIIDDCSSDDSLEIAESYQIRDNRVRIIANSKNKKQAYCRNIGIELSSGDYIAFLDSDDIACENRIQLQLEYLQNNPDCVGCGSHGEYIDKDGNLSGRYITPPVNYPLIKAEAFFGDNPFIQSSMMLRKDILNKYNLRYDESYGGIAEDYQFWLQILKNDLKLLNINKPLVYYRFGDNLQATVMNSHKFRPVVEAMVIENIELICHKKYIGKLYRQGLLRDDFLRKMVAILLYPLAAIMIIYSNNKSKILDKDALKKTLYMHSPRINLLRFVLR